MDHKDCNIRIEEKKDFRLVEELTRRAFWNIYKPGCDEHYVLHCFRNNPIFVPELSLVLEKEGKIIGHIMYVRSTVHLDDGGLLPILTFGPISIDPDLKRQGYGTLLLRESMKRAEAMGAGAIAITGNILFYGKSGFVAAKDLGIRYLEDPDADYFLAIELKEGYLDGISGTYTDPEGYFVSLRHPDEFEAYDASFPQMEKKVLPGQIHHE